MDYDVDVIGIIQGCCTTSERRVIKSPLRRRDLPNELGKLLAVFVVSCPAALGGKIILIPPLELSLWRERHLTGFLAADQIAAHRDHGLAALRPERRDDVGRPRTPIKTGKDRLLDLERVHEGDDIAGNRRRLAIAKCSS